MYIHKDCLIHIQLINTLRDVIGCIRSVCQQLSTVEPLAVSKVIQTTKKLLAIAVRDQGSSADISSLTVDDEVCLLSLTGYCRNNFTTSFLVPNYTYW